MQTVKVSRPGAVKLPSPFGSFIWSLCYKMIEGTRIRVMRRANNGTAKDEGKS